MHNTTHIHDDILSIIYGGGTMPRLPQPDSDGE